MVFEAEFNSTSGDGGRANADAAGFHRAAGVKGDAVFVDRDAGFVERVRGIGAVEALVAEVHQWKRGQGTGSGNDFLILDAWPDSMRIDEERFTETARYW